MRFDCSAIAVYLCCLLIRLQSLPGQNLAAVVAWLDDKLVRCGSAPRHGRSLHLTNDQVDSTESMQIDFEEVYKQSPKSVNSVSGVDHC